LLRGARAKLLCLKRLNLGLVLVRLRSSILFAAAPKSYTRSGRCFVLASGEIGGPVVPVSGGIFGGETVAYTDFLLFFVEDIAAMPTFGWFIHPHGHNEGGIIAAGCDVFAGPLPSYTAMG
jgi:hypothetical protein